MSCCSSCAHIKVCRFETQEGSCCDDYMPQGCDSCGYLRLAEDIRHGRLGADSLEFLGIMDEKERQTKERLANALEDLATYKQKYADEVEKRLRILEGKDG